MKKIIFLLLTATYLQATSPRYIESINYHSQQGATIALIKLTDDSTWKWLPDFYSENLLRKWDEGDEIFICVGNHPGFILQNRSHPHYDPPVALTFNSYLLFPSITGFSNETITLSDGTTWQYIYDFNKRTLRHWALGDRIIPVQGINKNLELINLDIPYDNRCQIERQLEVIPVQNS